MLSWPERGHATLEAATHILSGLLSCYTVCVSNYNLKKTQNHLYDSTQPLGEVWNSKFKYYIIKHCTILNTTLKGMFLVICTQLSQDLLLTPLIM